jgi:Low molecular weight phosphotyrosine protein phosphatase
MSAQPPKVLFVCTGNTCRSPYAAAVARQHGRRHKVQSRFRLVGAALKRRRRQVPVDPSASRGAHDPPARTGPRRRGTPRPVARDVQRQPLGRERHFLDSSGRTVKHTPLMHPFGRRRVAHTRSRDPVRGQIEPRERQSRCSLQTVDLPSSWSILPPVLGLNKRGREGCENTPLARAALEPRV